jgi:hypothetical protein
MRPEDGIYRSGTPRPASTVRRPDEPTPPPASNRLPDTELSRIGRALKELLQNHHNEAAGHKFSGR